MNKEVAIIGAGGWGTALAIMLGEKKANLALWIRNPDVYKEIKNKRENGRYLPGVSIPFSIYPTMKIDDAIKDREVVFLAVPSKAIRAICKEMASYLKPGTIIVNLAKGLEDESFLRMSSVITQELTNLENQQIAVLSGPNHAEEVSRKLPTATVIASNNYKTAEKVQDVVSTAYFRPYTNDDLIGVETGGALKNVIAIGAGIIDGLNMGDNTKAALLTRGLTEISRLGVAMGARQGTYAGLSGLGDLFVTCSSKHSRNRAVGVRLGRGEELSDILEKMQTVAEGINTTKVAYKLSKKYNVDMPITEEIYKVLFESKKASDALESLMHRKEKAESEEMFFDSEYNN